MVNEPATIVAVVADMIFESKITATAAHVGAAVRTVRTPAKAAELLGQCRSLLIDMNVAPSECLDLIRKAKAESPAIRIVSFLSHVQVDLARETRETGADEVMPRSKFAETLPDLLRALA